MKKWIIAGAVLLVAAGLFFWLRANVGLRGKPRKAWKDAAIAEVARETADPDWVASELAAFKSLPADAREDEKWISGHLLLMKNGEWIAYANICRKQDFRIPDLFIGRGSDGKWYYSTFHFCMGVIVLMMDDQPESLTQFIDWHYLNEFDGRSDECLNTTWPLKKGQVDPKASKRGRWPPR